MPYSHLNPKSISEIIIRFSENLVWLFLIMSGRGRIEKSKPLSKITAADNRRSSGGHREENHTQYHLPDELWEQIILKLSLKDNKRVSGVSQRFYNIAASVKKTDTPPWLAFCPKSGDTYKFSDPCKSESYWLELPELCGARFVHSKEGWLVMFKPRTSDLFLFCPYDHQVIELPSLGKARRPIVLSAAPTSPSCIVFSARHVDRQTTQINIWRPGQNEWNDVNYKNDIPFQFKRRDKLIFCNGLLYCFSFTGGVGIYNPSQGSWSVQYVTPPEFSKFSSNDWDRNDFMSEHDGDIIVMYTCTDRFPVIYKLDLPNKTWVEMETLGGRALFISYTSSHVRTTDLIGHMRDNVYFSKVQPYGRSYISYSLDKGEYFPGDKRSAWSVSDHIDSIWIDAPEDRSTVL